MSIESGNPLPNNYPLGNDRFREQIEKALGRHVGYNQRGRSRAKDGDKEIAQK